MNATHASLRTLLKLPLSQRSLLTWGAIVALALLSFYVHVLQESIVRSDKMRAERGASQSAPAWNGRAYAASNDPRRRAPAVPEVLRQFAIEGLGNVRP